MMKVIPPKGFSFKVSKRLPEVIIIHLRRKGRTIGRVNLEWVRINQYQTHSFLDEAYQNQGLGALMYAYAIRWAWKQGYLVRSSGYSSDKANRMWRGQTIRKWFKIRSKENSEGYLTFYPSCRQSDGKVKFGKKLKPGKKSR